MHTNTHIVTETLVCSASHTQGALDGGLNIPHNEKRFVGWTKEEGLEAEVSLGLDAVT